MRKRINKIAAGIAALAALALGGAAISQAGSSTPTQPTANPGQQIQKQSGTDTKNRSTAADQNGSKDAPDQGNDPADQGGANDKAEGNDSANSEVPGDDGPGGHADEPGNPNADHQAQGQE